MSPAGFQTILCPVDFSELSAAALRYAVTLGRCADSTVVAAYASYFEVPPYFTPSQARDLERQFRDSLNAAGDTLRRFAESTLGAEAAGVQTRVMEALPADGIRQFIRETHADLVVMGTHGRSGFNRWMLGSVAERVLREAEVPVLTVRGTAQPAPVRQILCAVNDTTTARRALGLAASLAACFHATLTALHVEEPHGGSPIADLCAWIPAEERSRCHLRELVRRGEAAEQIIALAAEMACDLLVIGAQPRRFFDSSILGTTTVRTVRHAPCPVLTVTR